MAFKKLWIFALIYLLLTGCAPTLSEPPREIAVEVKSVTCGDERLYSDAGCMLTTTEGRIYEFGTPLLQLNEGDTVVISVKGFNKIRKLRYEGESEIGD